MAKKGGSRSAATPYRGGGARDEGARGEGGLVDEIVRQFADPYAFHRELVQNAIDAGATKITVRLVHDPAERVLAISVNDDGSGMSQKILEEDLTVLFKSTKESRDDAIGKFGIGFVSVLALDPTAVIVDTSLGDGARHRLTLHRDHTYELHRHAGGERGTTVTLHVPTELEALPDRIAKSRASLERWCRHARVPITFFAHGESMATEPERIDRPLALVGATVQVSAVSADGRTEVVAGLTPKPTGAFYNRGLLLHETDEPFPRIGGVSFKVVDPRLEHTLSRDDVRRDGQFASVLEQVERTVHGPLVDALHRTLAHCDLDAWRSHFDAAVAAGLSLRFDAPVPVAHPDGTVTTLALDRIAVLRSLPVAPALHAALEASGMPVLALGRADETRLRELARIAGKLVGAADWSDALIVPEDHDAATTEMLSQLTELLGDVMRRPSRIVLARFFGAASGRLSIGAAVAGPTLLHTSELDADPFRFLARPPLVLDVGHPVMAAATAALRKRRNPQVVASLVCRAVLAQRGLLLGPVRTLVLERSLRQLLAAHGGDT